APHDARLPDRGDPPGGRLPRAAGPVHAAASPRAVTGGRRLDPRRRRLPGGPRPARGVLRGRAHRVRPRAGSRRHPVAAPGVGRAARDPARRDALLRRDRAGARRPGRLAGGGPRQRAQPDLDRRPVPPGGRLRRAPHGLRRRDGAQGGAPRPRAARGRALRRL
ncbi:MAG: Methylated-DNA--protein-cysteine methyltransferase, partial [uncultured Solirubrobacteraceae bacterium]